MDITRESLVMSGTNGFRLVMSFLHKPEKSILRPIVAVL